MEGWKCDLCAESAIIWDMMKAHHQVLIFGQVDQTSICDSRHGIGNLEL